MADFQQAETKTFDTIVVGSGLAGLTAAYHASKKGSVAIITKSQLDISNSYYAQGGIAAVTDPEDSFESHIQDTLTAGRGLCDLDAVKILVSEGQHCVQELISLGMQFDKENGDYVLGLEGGHSHRRILHAGGDATGKGLTLFMLKKVQEQNNISVFEYTTVIDLLVIDGVCLGVQALDFISNNNLIFRSKSTIIATGGLSRIYDRSTNPHTATGDGIALAYNAGAELADVEFIQFHPSALYIPGEEAFLISEAVRGEGAWLFTPTGERFMPPIHPLAELAPRDVVAHAIYNQMQLYHSDFVYLSLKHLNPDVIKKRFSTIYHTLLKYNIDLTTDLLPIAPAAHYMVGGIRTDLHGETNIKGLFACGEVASTGVMGANRLASNSLLECLVFGRRAAEKATNGTYANPALPELTEIHVNPANENLFLEIKNRIASLMSKKAGIVRNGEKLQQAIDELHEIGKLLPEQITEYNHLKIKQNIDICRLICESALIREESRGGHIREDFPKENPQLCVHLIQQKGEEYRFEAIRNS
ncbi:MAG TPA: L-aspartate oxidase [Prolixibacteraceae bacterium]|nr:L-aspartate oxidase [Prolixibacteraceae bacterium]